jgi:hypothetical protein
MTKMSTSGMPRTSAAAYLLFEVFLIALFALVINKNDNSAFEGHHQQGQTGNDTDEVMSHEKPSDKLNLGYYASKCLTNYTE